MHFLTSIIYMYIIVSFPPLSMLKMIIVPRQARDKHSESTQKRDAHSHRQREADKLAAVEAEAKRKKVEKNRKKKAKKKKKLAEKEAAAAGAADSARVATIVAEAPEPEPQQVSEPKPKPDDGTAELRAKFDAGVEQWSAAQVVQWVALQAELLPAGSTQLVTAAFESLGAEGNTLQLFLCCKHSPHNTIVYPDRLVATNVSYSKTLTSMLSIN